MCETPSVHLVIVAARHRPAHARALEESALAVHPDWQVLVVEAGDARPRAAEGCAALVPVALGQALDRGADVAVHLDPAARVEGCLDQLVAAARRHGLALVAATRAGADPERALQVGAFACGTVAIGQEGRTFLDWWRDRLAREGDAAWIAGAVPYFGAAVVRDLPLRYELEAPSPPRPVPTEVRADPPAVPPDPGPTPVTSLARGVNLVLGRSSDAPLVEVAGAIASCLEELGLPLATIGFDAVSGRLDGVHPRLAPYDTSLVCLNPLDLVGFAFHVDAEFFDRRRSIGVWLAERTPAPDLGAALGFLDEVWAPSGLAARGLRSRTDLAVEAFPVPVETTAASFDRRALALPRGQILVSVADLGTVFTPGALERSNPLGLIEAFELAFAEDEGPTLVLRLVDGERNRLARERVRLATERGDVLVIDGPLTPSERRALVQAADCYASLHRATDFELAAVEAFAAGTPVVATGTETLRALTGDDAHLVRSSQEALPPDLAAWWTPATWEEPDLDEAARLLRLVFARPRKVPSGAVPEHEPALAGAARAHLKVFLEAHLVPVPRGRLSRLLDRRKR